MKEFFLKNEADEIKKIDEDNIKIEKNATFQ